MTDVEAIRREHAALVERYGAWTAHNVRLADGVYAMAVHPTGDEVKLRRVTQLVSDLCAGQLEGLRVLDLACLEGMYALELARRGAEVVAIEGREANIEKARFGARALGLDGIEFLQEDVRGLSLERHGSFDVVLCLGILYHLDAPDVFAFVERVAEVCRQALVVDTAVALRDGEREQHGEREYRGLRVVEHTPDATDEELLGAVWSSLDNRTAFALTRPSLESLLARSGFTSVAEVHVPAEPAKTLDRLTLLAFKGRPVGELLVPSPREDASTVPEQPPLTVRLLASRAGALGRLVVPRPLRRHVRRLLGAETRRH